MKLQPPQQLNLLGPRLEGHRLARRLPKHESNRRGGVGGWLEPRAGGPLHGQEVSQPQARPNRRLHAWPGVRCLEIAVDLLEDPQQRRAPFTQGTRRPSQGRNQTPKRLQKGLKLCTLGR